MRERERERERESLASILTGDEVYAIAELDFQITVAHEVLQADLLDDTGFGTLDKHGHRVVHGVGLVQGFSFLAGEETPRKRSEAKPRVRVKWSVTKRQRLEKVSCREEWVWRENSRVS